MIYVFVNFNLVNFKIMGRIYGKFARRNLKNPRGKWGGF